MTLSAIRFDGSLADINLYSSVMTLDLKKSEPALYSWFQGEGEDARKHFIATQYYFWKAQRDLKSRDNFLSTKADLKKAALAA